MTRIALRGSACRWSREDCSAASRGSLRRFAYPEVDIRTCGIQYKGKEIDKNNQLRACQRGLLADPVMKVESRGRAHWNLKSIM